MSQGMTPREWAMLLALSVLWGGSFLFAKVAVGAIPPFGVVGGRVMVAAATLGVVLLVTGIGLPRGADAWRAFFGMGLLNNVIPFSLIFWGQTAIGAGLASILNATTPLFTVLVAHALTADEKITWNKLAGVLIGFGGVALMIGPDLTGSAAGGVLPQLACLGAAISYAFSGVYGRRFARMGIKPLHAAFGQLTASTVMVVPALLVVAQPWTWPAPGLPPIAALLALAVFSTALAYGLFFRILGSAGATNIALVTFLIPVSAILLGAVFLGERLGWRDFAGMGLVALGLAAIDPRVAALMGGRRAAGASQAAPR